MSKVTEAFNAEIKQLLDIVIHSLYSQKEIFLRELISNASDAIDKLKFESITKPELIAENANFEIRLEVDKANKTLKIIDNGIGMSTEEVKQFIGTIAKSGTKAYSQLNKNLSAKPELIGQFGVGFYSAFMVADRVTLHTHKAGTSEGTIWESSGDGQYSIENFARTEGRGTTITLHLKKLEDVKHEDGSTESAQDFTDTWTLKSVIKKYSDFISWPIKMKVEHKKENETVLEDETLNSQKALWLRPTHEIKAEEYDDFFQHLTHDWNKPAKHVHYKAEGVTEFTSLLYFPSQKPWNYNMKEYEFGLSLYIKRVFIMDNTKDLLPGYLRFVKGLVDSSDLSLNVSRELLQQDRLVAQIRKNIVGKILSTLKDWQHKDRNDYEKFWLEFGSTIKEGIATDASNKEKIQDLILFKSTHSEAWTNLDEYFLRMKPEQKDIYYITGEKLEQIQNSPYLEKLKQKGFEVLLLNEAIDEWVTQGITDYKTKKLISITQEGLELDSEDEKKQKEESKKAQLERYKSLLDKMKLSLSESVKDVVVSDRLTETPVCLVSAQNEMSANMQKILSKMEGYNKSAGKRILEVNLSHKIFEQMMNLNDEQINTWSEILFNQALLAEGSALPNPSRYSKLIADLMLAKGARS
jgi:molecular chaperone HtpG